MRVIFGDKAATVVRHVASSTLLVFEDQSTCLVTNPNLLRGPDEVIQRVMEECVQTLNDKLVRLDRKRRRIEAEIDCLHRVFALPERTSLDV